MAIQRRENLSQSQAINIPFTIQSLPRLLDAAPVVVLKILAGRLQKHARSSKLPGVVAEEFSPQLILLVLQFDRLEKAAGLLWFPALLLGLENDLRLRGFRKRLHTLPQHFVLNRAIANKHFRWGNLAHHVNPLWQLFRFPTGELVESGLSHPEGCEVVFAHRGRSPTGVDASRERIEDARWNKGQSTLERDKIAGVEKDGSD